MSQKFNRFAFGKALMDWRVAYGFTQIDVALAIGCSCSFISDVENVKGRGGYKMTYLLRIADVIEVNFEDFIYDHDWGEW